MNNVIDRFWSTVEVIWGIYNEGVWDIEFLHETFKSIADYNVSCNFNVNKNIIDDLYESVKNIEILTEDMNEYNCSNLKDIHRICSEMLEICGCHKELSSYEV